jgi:hypothetical protein
MSSAVLIAGRRLGVVFIACVGHLIGSPALADTSGWDRFTLTLSGYKPSIDTQVRFDASTQVSGISLDLEDDLLLDDGETLTQYYASLHITRQISLEGSFFELGRSAQTVLNGSIEFGDTVFPVDIDVTTSFAAEVATFGLSWTFLRSDTVEVSASAGGYWMSLAAGIDSATVGQAEVAEADLLLPMAGLSFGWNLTPKLQLMLNGDYMSVDYADFDGSIINLRAGLRYRILEYVGIGVGYDLLEIEVESTSSSFSGLVNYRQCGPKAFLSLRF